MNGVGRGVLVITGTAKGSMCGAPIEPGLVVSKARVLIPILSH